MHSASQLQNPPDYGLDPALGAVSNNSLMYHPGKDYEYKDQSGPADNYGLAFDERDSHVVKARSEEQDDVDSMAAGPGGAVGQPKKASKSSAANELEMRQLFNQNKHRSLPDVARELHGNERGPMSERQRQVFAMLWYVVSWYKSHPN